jgi:hypothetical protein
MNILVKFVKLVSVYIYSNFFRFFYFLQSIEIGLQLNIENPFSYGTAGSTLTVFEIAVAILWKQV